ncbi:S8 family serine peptidase [Thalassotalea fusca]
MSVKSFLILISLSLILTTFSYAKSPPDLKQYVVVLKAHTNPNEVAASIARQSNGRVGFLYNHTIKGFSIAVSSAALNGILRNPNVSYVEEDIPMTAFVQNIPTGVERIFANQAELDIDGLDDFRVDVDVAVLDTGIDEQHSDLNVVGGANCLYTTKGPGRSRKYFCDESLGGDDDHYHGTHVAGTIAALDNDEGVVGVAPGARLWAVKVLNSQGSGSLSGIIAGVDWVVAQGNIEVINMSLGGSGSSSAMNDSISAAVASGVTVVVSAGNSNADSSGFTPANSPDAITVSALADFNGLPGGGASPTCRSDQDDTLADFSNWGSTVDITAPGVCITSTFPIERGGYGTISGTSMSAPHVAGAAALLASNNMSPATIESTLLSKGNFDWVDDSGDGIMEPLLDIGAADFNPVLIATGTDSNNPPTASFSASCSLLDCEFDASASSDSDGTIVSYSWDFGDGNSGNGETTSHTYASDGTYSVTLTVMDDDNDSDATSDDVNVSSEQEATLLTDSINNGSTWTAVVYNANNEPLLGTWSSGEGTCSDNTCSQSGIRKKQQSVTFTSDEGETVIVYKP